MFEEKIKQWEMQLISLLETICAQRDELEENRKLIERLQDRHSEYKQELGHMVDLANIWKTRAVQMGWRK